MLRCSARIDSIFAKSGLSPNQSFAQTSSINVMA